MSQNSLDEQTLSEFTSFDDNVKKAEIQDSHGNVAAEYLEKVTTVNSVERQYLHGKELAFVFVGLSLSLFLSALDSTIVATALPKIASEFNSLDRSSWVVTSYILTYNAFQPLYSKFSDIFGRKQTLMVGIVIFLVGSALCGAATSMDMLFIFRALQGFGGAGVFSLTMIVMSEIVPLENRGKYNGVINAVFALSSVFGPLVGGAIVDNTSWRWIFYINLPFGLSALVVIWYYLHFPNSTGSLREKLRRIDFLGTFFIVTATTSLLFALESGGSQYPWGSPSIITCIVVGIFLYTCFIVVEWKFAAEPLIPLRLFKNRSIAAVYFGNWMFGTAFFGIVINLPYFFQIVENVSATDSGLKLLPLQLSICTSSSLSGYLISRFGTYRALYITGTTFMTIAMILISFFSETLADGAEYGFMVIAGIGLGFILSSSIIAAQSASEVRDLAVVTGTANFMRILGGAIGLAVCSAALQTHLDAALPAILPPALVGPAKQSATFIHNNLTAEVQPAVIQVYVEGFQLMFHVLVAFTGLSLIASLFVKHHPLKRAKKASVLAPAPVTEKDLKKDLEKQAPLEDGNFIHEPSLVLSKVPTSDAINLGVKAVQIAVVGGLVVYDTNE